MDRSSTAFMALVWCAAWLAATGTGCGPHARPDPPDADEDGLPVGSESCIELGLDDGDEDGISNDLEGEADSDGDGTRDRLDTDSDGDGRSDTEEAGDGRACDDALVDSDGDGTPDVLDLDSDANGLLDADEGDGDVDGDGVDDWRDSDDDGDGIPDTVELDGHLDDPPDNDGDGVADYHDSDSDGDGIDDQTDGTDDVDGDGAGNWRDSDSDNDGIPDGEEGLDDCDGDGRGNYVDLDSNGDGLPDWDPRVVLDGACPPCTPGCVSSGPVIPSPADPGAEGLVANPGGGVAIDTGASDSGFAWVANTTDPWPGGSASESGSVSKIDLETGREVARYLVGHAGLQNAPSGTAVDDRGDAYVVCMASSAAGIVVKIAGDRANCEDRNGNGAIDTSAGPEPLPLGEDECVLWDAEVGSRFAAPRGVVVDLGGPGAEDGAPWVGLTGAQALAQVDPDDGEVLQTVALSVSPLSLTLDSEGAIWVTGGGASIQRIDPETGEADAMITASSHCLSGAFQSIAADSRGRIWTATTTTTACRYDPSERRWLRVDLGMMPIASMAIAVDAADTVWVAASGPWSWSGAEGLLFGFDAEGTGDVVSYETGGLTPSGVSVDARGNVWTVNQDSDDVSRLEPATGDVERFEVGDMPTAYTDFIGAQRRRAAPTGTWSTTIEACPDRGEGTELRWGNLVWDAVAPGESRIELVVRTAQTEAGLATAFPVPAAMIPGVSSPVDLGELLDRAGVFASWFLEVTAVLEGRGHTPALESVEVSWRCVDEP